MFQNFAFLPQKICEIHNYDKGILPTSSASIQIAKFWNLAAHNFVIVLFHTCQFDISILIFKCQIKWNLVRAWVSQIFFYSLKKKGRGAKSFNKKSYLVFLFLLETYCAYFLKLVTVTVHTVIVVINSCIIRRTIVAIKIFQTVVGFFYDVPYFVK